MPDGLDWLPPELYPAAMRIARADECAYTIGELAALWSFNGPLGLVQLKRGDRVTTKVSSIRPIPPRISLLFSEAVNHLRAALDNAVWYLVVQAQGEPIGKVANQVALPIYDDQRSFDKWQKDRLKAGLTAFDASADLGGRLHALQPFVDQASSVPSTSPLLAALAGFDLEEAHPLKLLQAYSNADKHRAIRVAVPRTSGGAVNAFEAPRRAFVELQVGDVVAEGPWGEPVMIEQTSSVQIERPAPYSALVAPGNELSQLATYVAHTALPQLIAGTALPDLLPLKVDLDDSGLSELGRLVAGDHVPAQDRLRPWMTAKYFEAEKQPMGFPAIVEDPLDDEPVA